MKKVIFSAIALLAFTATSFAAEGKKEVKKAEVKTEVKMEVKEEEQKPMIDWAWITCRITAIVAVANIQENMSPDGPGETGKAECIAMNWTIHTANCP